MFHAPVLLLMIKIHESTRENLAGYCKTSFLKLILGLQPRDKAAMLVVKTKEFASK